MDKVRFYRTFHVALAVVCVLLHWPICFLWETAEYYEELYSAGIRYSKLLLVLNCFIVVQFGFAVEEALPLPLSPREREQIPEPELRLLLEHFVSKFLARSVRIVSIVCWNLFFAEWLVKDRDGVVKGGMPFLVVFIGLKLYRCVYLKQEFRLL